MTTPAPELSVVVPVAADDPAAGRHLQELLALLPNVGTSFELLACEYGRADDETSPLNELVQRHPELHVMPSNLDRALRDGLREARGTFVLCDTLGADDLPFLDRALPLMRSGEAELVAGSGVLGRPLAGGSPDVWATRAASTLLAITTGFRGTDAGGPKLLRRDRLTEVADACVSSGELFPAELVVRAGRMARKVVEVPCPPRLRLPAPRRLPVTATELARVAWALRLTGR